MELIFKRIGDSYVYWYNWKYRRKGHLFQDRYKSEPVEENAYFLMVLRYIHQTPIKAGQCKKLESYPYSGYNEYINPTSNQLIGGGFALSMIGKDEFIRYHQLEYNDPCLETEGNNVRLTDKEAQKIIFD